MKINIALIPVYFNNFMKWVKELFSDSGTASIMRVCFFMLITSGIVISFIQAFTGKDLIALVGTIFSTATVLKISQKIVENKDTTRISANEQ
jgi:hypothetical protein